MPQFGAQTGDGPLAALRFFRKLVACLVQVCLLAGCATQQFQLDEPEMHLIAHSQSQIGECLGTPTRKHDDGDTSIWSYDVAQSSGPCSLNVIFKQKYVSRLTFTDASGNPLPAGQECWTVNQGWCSNVQQAPATSPPSDSL